MKKSLSGALAGSLVLGMLCVPMCAFADEATITVTVSAYDFNAVDGGIAAASADGVILDQYSVEVPVGTTDVEAIQKAFEDNGISLTVSESYYGGYYVSEINGLSEYSNPAAEPDYSGWMLEYNDDHFTNYGVGSLGANGDGVLSDGDAIEFHYSLDGGTDLGSVYSGIPVLNSLTVGDKTVALAKTTSYDESWNPVFSFTADGEAIEGEGTEENPFVLSYDLGEVESSEAAVSYIASHYFAVDGITEIHDFSEPLHFTVATESGLVSYYTVNADYTLVPDGDDEGGQDDENNNTDDENNTNGDNNANDENNADDENQSAPTGDTAAAGILFAVAAAAVAAAAASRKAEEA